MHCAKVEVEAEVEVEVEVEVEDKVLNVVVETGVQLEY